MPNVDILLSVDIEGKSCPVFVCMRPGCIEFLEAVQRHYEVVIYTASLSKYASPLIDKLDSLNTGFLKLFREHCTFFNGMFVKDLTKLGRSMKDLIIIDVSPAT